jgi:hypothetical protein
MNTISAAQVRAGAICPFGETYLSIAQAVLPATKAGRIVRTRLDHPEGAGRDRHRLPSHNAARRRGERGTPPHRCWAETDDAGIAIDPDRAGLIC